MGYGADGLVWDRCLKFDSMGGEGGGLWVNPPPLSESFGDLAGVWLVKIL